MPTGEIRGPIPPAGALPILCRRSHGDGGLTRGYVTHEGVFAVEDLHYDMTGVGAEVDEPIRSPDENHPEIHYYTWQRDGVAVLSWARGADRAPRRVSMSVVGPSPSNWECSVEIRPPIRTPPGTALCYISHTTLSRGLGPPVPMIYVQRTGELIRRDAHDLNYWIEPEIPLPFERKLDDGVELLCWR